MRHEPSPLDSSLLSRLLPLIDRDIVDLGREHTHLFLSNAKRALLYFGAVHTCDPSHPQFKDLHTLFDDFGPTVTLIEGAEPFRSVLPEEQYQRQAKAILKDSEETLIRKAGEILFTARWLQKRGAFFFVPSPLYPRPLIFSLNEDSQTGRSSSPILC